VFVRAAAPDEGPPARYVIGGRAIEDAHPSVHHRAVRPDDVRREKRRAVFVVGESAGFGFPYAYAQSFAALLDARVRAKGLAVLNASQVGATSADLEPVVERIAGAFEPAALVLMIGNNEWIQWLPPHEVPVSPSRIRLLRALSASRAIAGVEYWLLKRSVDARNAELATGASASDAFLPHAELSGHAYALRHSADDLGFDASTWPATRDEFLRAFESNLEAMARAAGKHGARVVLLTLPFNHRLSPAWKHPQPEAFDAAHRDATRTAIHSAARAIETRTFDTALTEIDRALALDPAPPILHYLRGAALEALGRPLEAEAAYAQCRERMIGNLGSRLSINASIAKVAAETGAKLLDVEKLFEDYEHAHGACCNADLIHDDCHPTPLGHRLIAEALEPLVAP
jgi:lysophospholipase L1-like esterase